MRSRARVASAEAALVEASIQGEAQALQVRAGEAGVLQELPLQLGQWVSAGTLVAKVARPDRLKAEVRIAVRGPSPARRWCCSPTSPPGTSTRTTASRSQRELLPEA